MSYESSYHEYHLTPGGWVNSDELFLSDRIETWSRRMTQGLGWSKGYIEWKCIWKSQSLPDEERQELWERFPKPYRDFTMSTL